MRYNFLKFFFSVVLLLIAYCLFAQSSYAVNCSPPIAGNYTISASCSFANTVDGVDAGSGTTNTAVMTIPNGVTLTVGSIANQTIGYGSITIQSGGSIIINKGVGASLKKGPIWAQDADGDGYPPVANPAELVQATQPAGYSRRNILISLTTVDCYDYNANAHPGQTAFFTTDRGDGSFDYDCDGIVTPQINCVATPLSCLGAGAGFYPGWFSAVPSCGTTANLYNLNCQVSTSGNCTGAPSTPQAYCIKYIVPSSPANTVCWQQVTSSVVACH